MTSEREIREIAAAEVREALRRCPVLWENHPHLTEDEWSRCVGLITDYPILDLPVPDRDGCWWPTNGRNYGHVKRGVVRHPECGAEKYVRISRGEHPITMTPAEALELAAILTAAAMEEA